MRSALYYPHTEIKSESLLKTALLLWDEVRVIVPWPHYEPTYPTHSLREAFELVGKAHYPTDSQKRKTHKLVEDFATRKLPESFMYRSLDTRDQMSDRYEVYPQKLLPETWRALQDADLVSRHMLVNSDYEASGPTGLSLMGLLADSCAGETFMRVTDRGDAYASLAGLFTEDEDEVIQPRSSQLDRLDEILEGYRFTQVRNELVAIALDVVDASNLSLDQLIAFRKSEHKTGGRAIRALRHRLSDSVEAQAALLMKVKSDEDLAETKRQFAADMRDDYASLREALKLEVNQVLGSREIITTVLAAVGTAAVVHAGLSLPMHDVWTATGGLFTLGGLYATKSKFARTREKLLLEHPTAYLYEARGGLRR